jgi:hypothetical protein
MGAPPSSSLSSSTSHKISPMPATVMGRCMIFPVSVRETEIRFFNGQKKQGMHVGDRDVFTDGFGESPCTKSSPHLFEKNRSTKVPVGHLKAIVFF